MHRCPTDPVNSLFKQFSDLIEKTFSEMKNLQAVVIGSQSRNYNSSCSHYYFDELLLENIKAF